VRSCSREEQERGKAAGERMAEGNNRGIHHFSLRHKPAERYQSDPSVSEKVEGRRERGTSNGGWGLGSCRTGAGCRNRLHKPRRMSAVAQALACDNTINDNDRGTMHRTNEPVDLGRRNASGRECITDDSLPAFSHCSRPTKVPKGSLRCLLRREAKDHELVLEQGLASQAQRE
jgi:hypothetical protein